MANVRREALPIDMRGAHYTDRAISTGDFKQARFSTTREGGGNGDMLAVGGHARLGRQTLDVPGARCGDY